MVTTTYFICKETGIERRFWFTESAKLHRIGTWRKAEMSMRVMERTNGGKGGREKGKCHHIDTKEEVRRQDMQTMRQEKWKRIKKNTYGFTQISSLSMILFCIYHKSKILNYQFGSHFKNSRQEPPIKNEQKKIAGPRPSIFLVCSR